VSEPFAGVPHRGVGSKTNAQRTYWTLSTVCIFFCTAIRTQIVVLSSFPASRLKSRNEMRWDRNQIFVDACCASFLCGRDGMYQTLMETLDTGLRVTGEANTVSLLLSPSLRSTPANWSGQEVVCKREHAQICVDRSAAVDTIILVSAHLSHTPEAPRSAMLTGNRPELKSAQSSFPLPPFPSPDWCLVCVCNRNVGVCSMSPSFRLAIEHSLVS
jgi:hypothetical protein